MVRDNHSASRFDLSHITITTGTCVIVIAMLNALDPAITPGAKPRPYTRSDVATFYEIWDVAVRINAKCVEQGKSRAGWSFAGESAHDALLNPCAL